MKRLFTLLSVIFVLSLTACSKDIVPTTGSIYGTVYDAATGDIVNNALVTLLPIGNSVTTASDGSFQFIDISADNYTLQCSADGYSPRNQTVMVYAGSNNICDIHMEKASFVSGITLSTNILNFGTNETEKSFSISNIGNSGDISWSMSTITMPWLHADPMSGSISQGKQGSVKVRIDRSYITKDQSTYLIINAGGGSMQIAVYVNSGNSDNGGGGQVYEDYSSATVITCDSRVKTEIVSCKRTGSTVVFTYRLTNIGLGVVNDWRIYPTNSTSLVSGSFLSTVFDNLGNEYFYSLFTFRNSSSKNSVVGTTFPEDAPCKGTVTVYDVPKNASQLTIMLGVYAYPDQSYYLADKRIYFKNVPIY